MNDLSKLNEAQLKRLFVERMSPHFRIVDGDAEDAPECVHYFTGRRLRPDFLCYPLKMLRDGGWPDWLFYVEVKDALGGNQGSRISEVAWQARQYQDCVCRFRVPAFTLVFPNFEVFIKTESPQFKAYAGWFAGYMQRERVGELFLPDDGSFKIKFSSAVLFDSRDARSNFHLLDHQHRGSCQ